MTKPELARAISEKAGLKLKDAEAFINAFVEVVENTLKKGDKVSLIGFGIFNTRKRAKRTGVNPKTGKKIKIPAKTVPHFKPGKKLREAVK